MTAAVTVSRNDAPARVLALMVAANGRIDDWEIRMLEELRAWDRLGVDPQRFQALAEEGLAQLRGRLRDRVLLAHADRRYVDGLLAQVSDTRERLTVCRLAAAAITADGRVTADERLLFDHVLDTWNINHRMIADAILAERAGERATGHH